MAVEKYNGQPNTTDILPYLVGETIAYAFQNGVEIFFVFRSGSGLRFITNHGTFTKMTREEATKALDTRRRTLEKLMAQHGEFWPPDLTSAAREETVETGVHDRFERKDPV